MSNDNPSPRSAPISGKSDTIPAYLKSAAPEIDFFRRMFDEYRAASDENRRLQQLDRDYYDGPKALSAATRAMLKTRGQPEIYENLIRGAIDGTLGVMQGSQTDPRAYPRNPSDEEVANVASKTLRFIADVSKFDEIKLDCAENYLIEGACASITEFADDDIKTTQIRHDEFFHDPYARRHDFKDARYLGVAQWKDLDEIKLLYPEAVAAEGDPLSWSSTVLDSLWGDKPENAGAWIDRTRKRILICEVYYNRAGQWNRAVFCAAYVFEHDVSAYRGKKGTRCPIEAQSCYVDRENNRYGRVRDMIPMADETNARRSRLLHLNNSRQVQQTDPLSAPVDSSIARTEAAKADGVIPAGWQIVPTADLANGQYLLLQDSRASISRMGPTPAVLGRVDGNNQSGRSRQVLQQAGMTELARPMGRLDEWEARCYDQMWLCAQQFWTAPKFIRVTDQVRAPEFIQVNEPVLGMVSEPVVDEAGQPMADEMGQPMMRPGIGVVSMKNRLAEMDMDITITSVPDTANLQAETFGEFVELVRAGIDPFTPQFEILIEMSSIADKTRVLEALKAKRDEIQKTQAEAQQAAQALQQQQAEGEAAKTEAEAADKMAGAQHKAAQASLVGAEAERAHAENAVIAGLAGM